jgi:ssDNA-binding Zn-finger/Zn-ribbon topoisomerase 1
LFYGCSGYPGCSFAVWKEVDLPKKIEELAAAGQELPFREQSLEALHTKVG